MLTIAGAGLELIAFWAAMNKPEVTPESAHAASSIVAPGAAALAHSTSSAASMSSPFRFTPGSAQLLIAFAGEGWTVDSEPDVYFERPIALRKVVQSEFLYRSVSSITTIVWPFPVVPLANNGLKS